MYIIHKKSKILGKGLSIWDTFCHEQPSRIKDETNGDVALDSYHKYKEDVQLLKNMGAHFYVIFLNHQFLYINYVF